MCRVLLKVPIWTRQSLWPWLSAVNSLLKKWPSTGSPNISELSLPPLQSSEFTTVKSRFPLSSPCIHLVLSSRCHPLLRIRQLKRNFDGGWRHGRSWTCRDLCDIPCCLVVHSRRNGGSGHWIESNLAMESQVNPAMFWLQILATMLLLLCICAVTDKKNTQVPSSLVPLYLGFLLVAIGCCFGANCGFAVNPARDLAPRILTLIAGWGNQVFR